MTKVDEVVARERAKGGGVPPHYGIEELRAICQEVHDAAVAEAGKDAERYRWLRDVGDSTWACMASRVPEGAAGIDASIDAAVAAAKANPATN